MSRVELIISGRMYCGRNYTETFKSEKYWKMTDEQLRVEVDEIYAKFNETCGWNKTREVLEVCKTINNDKTNIIKI